MVKWLILVMGVAANASASVLIKIAMQPGRPAPSLAAPLTVLSNCPLLMGVGLYGAAFVLYAAALARLPLNIVHPILTSGAIASVAIISVIIFNEPMRWNTLVGVSLIIIGVIFLALRPQ